MANWRRRFDEPIHLRDGSVIRTLSDARRWLIEIDSDRNEYQSAAGRLLEAADGGDMDAAREQLVMAAFLNMKLDISKSRT